MSVSQKKKISRCELSHLQQAGERGHPVAHQLQLRLELGVAFMQRGVARAGARRQLLLRNLHAQPLVVLLQLGDAHEPARAENPRFWMLSALRAHTKPP
jgi:hypothetical protein